MPAAGTSARPLDRIAWRLLRRLDRVQQGVHSGGRPALRSSRPLVGGPGATDSTQSRSSRNLHLDEQTMTSIRCLPAAAVAVALAACPAAAQNTGDAPSQQQERIGAILGALFGDRLGVTTSIEAQWAAGRTPLLTQRNQFTARIDSDVRSGAINQTTGTRLKSDYAALVDLETRYGSDRRFTAEERADLASRYEALTRVLADARISTPGWTPSTPASATWDTGAGQRFIPRAFVWTPSFGACPIRAFPPPPRRSCASSTATLTDSLRLMNALPPRRMTGPIWNAVSAN